MTMRTLSRISLVLSAVSSLTSLGAQTSSLIVPEALRDGVTEGLTSTSWPWNLADSSAARMQYLYDSSHFSNGAAVTSAIVIHGLRWRLEGGASISGSGTAGQYGDVRVRVGAAGVDYLAAQGSFSQNWAGGTEPALAYRGTVDIAAVGAAGAPGAFYVSVTLQNAVTYDPSSGDDLIVEIGHDGLFSGRTGLSDVATGAQDPRTARVWSLSAPDAPTGFVQQDVGLCCELLYTPAAGLFADFRASASSVGGGEAVHFFDRSRSSASGGITGWAWDFDGDGMTDSTDQNPTTTFSVCGATQVSLTVSDGISPSATVTLPGPSVVAPVADFGFVSGIAPITIPFADQSTGAPTQWEWDFDGDGVVDSTMQNPSWSFANEEAVDVTLTVTSSCGSDSVTRSVDTRSMLCSPLVGGLSLVASGDGAGNMFDLDVRQPAGITVTRLFGLIDADPMAMATVDSEVWIVPGSYVGNETDRSVWTLVSRGQLAAVAATGATDLQVNPFCLQQGAYGVYVYCDSSAGDLLYSPVVAGAPPVENVDLLLTPGAAQPTRFLNTITDRQWNGCIDYDVGMTQPGQVSVLGGGCANSAGGVASIDLAGGVLPVAGQDLIFDLTQAPASASISAVVFGFETFPGGVDLSIIGMPGCALWVNGAIALPAPTDVAGAASLTLSPGSGLTSVGLTFFAQALAADPTANAFGIVTSDAVRIVVGCP